MICAFRDEVRRRTGDRGTSFRVAFCQSLTETRTFTRVSELLPSIGNELLGAVLL